MSLFNKSKKMFSRIFITLFLTLIFPMSILMLIFFKDYSSNKVAHFNEYNHLRSESIGTFTSSIMNNIESDMLKFYNQSVFIDFRNNEPDKYVNQTINLFKEINSFKLKYSFIDSVYFYDSKMGILFTDRTGTNILKDYYDTDWMDEFDNLLMLQRLNIRFINSSNLIKTTTNDLSKSIFSLAAKVANNRHIIVNIDTAKLASHISKYNILNDEAYCVFSDNHSLVFTTQSNEQQALSVSEHFIEFKHDLTYNTWNGVFLVPTSELEGEIKYISKFILTQSILLIMIYLILISLAAKYIYQPIKNLNADIKSHINTTTIDSRDEIKFFKDIFDSLETENHMIHSQIDFYQDTITQYTLKDFLKGTLSIDEFLLYIDKNNLNIKSSYYTILLLSKTMDEEIIITKETSFNILTVLNSYLENIKSGIVIDSDNYFVIFLSALNIDKLNLTTENIKNISRESLNIGHYIGMSRHYNFLNDTPTEYESALKSIEFSIFTHNPTFTKKNDPLANRNNQFHSLVALQQKLVISIQINNTDKVNLIITSFIGELKQLDTLDYLYKLTFFLITTLESNFPIHDIIEYDVYTFIQTSKNIVELETMLSDICHKLCIYTQTLKENENIYVSQAIQYISANYKSCINVSQVAEYLNISCPYLSKLFKEVKSQNVVDYINLKRIEEGKHLLISSNFSIKKISVVIGYNNHQSFERYFKKYNKMTPGQYRKINQTCHNA